MAPLFALNLLQTEPWPNHSFPLPLYQCHRGYWIKGLAENSLQALCEARRKNFQMAEFDVQLTRDGIPVVFHDKNLIRRAQKNIAVKDLTAAEMAELVQAPTLEEVLEHPEVPEFLNVEIKSGHILQDPLVGAVAEVLRQTKSQSRVVLSSFNPWALLRMKRLLPEVPLALLASEEKDPMNFMYLRRLWTAPLLRPQILHLDYRMLNEPLLKSLRDLGCPVAAWTVNDAEIAQDLLNAGVRSIITDSLSPSSSESK